MERYDVAIIGSGPAGIEAAVNLTIRNKKFIIFGQKNLSKKITSAARIDNYLGLPGISGQALQEKFIAHMDAMNITITPQQIQMIYPMGDFFALTSSQENYEATAVILAPGTAHAKAIPGEEEFLGKGVSYCATCDAPLYRGKTVVILGYHEEAVHEADFVAELAAKVIFLPMRKLETPPSAPVEVRTAKVEAIQGNAHHVTDIILDGEPLPADGVFILRESVAPTALLPGIDTRGGYIHVDQNMHTNITGCYAAGDCTGQPHQYMRAAGQGQTAALHAVMYLDALRKEHAAEKG